MNKDLEALMLEIKMLFAAFPSCNATPETVLVYVADLEEIDIAELKPAMKSVRSKWRMSTLPPIAEILAEVQAVRAIKQQAYRMTQVEEERKNRQMWVKEPIPDDIKDMLSKAGVLRGMSAPKPQDYKEDELIADEIFQE